MNQLRNDDAVDCCIAGSGPAGAMLGLLLARAGVNVLVLEKHADFLRDFRGDTIHPSTLEVLDDLGLAGRFLQLPHSEVSQLSIDFPDGEQIAIEFGRIGAKFPFIAFVPQWDFLDFITAEAARYPTFRLLRNAEVTDLLRQDERIAGVRYHTPEGERTAHALLTVGADGRSSRTRAAAGLPVVETSPPMDVLWFRLSRRTQDGDDAGLRVAPGRLVAVFNRTDNWQVGYVIPKGGDAQVRAAGLEAFRRAVAETVPMLADRVSELQDWEQVKLLTVRSDRLKRWYREGYLAIGDAAHAMSPVGGVGINLAIQDAVVAANLLSRPLLDGAVATQRLARVQRRRELTVRMVQAMQTFIQDQVLKPTLAQVDTSQFKSPPGLKLLSAVPFLRDLPARVIAYGIIRPHVRSPERSSPNGQTGPSGDANQGARLGRATTPAGR